MDWDDWEVRIAGLALHALITKDELVEVSPGHSSQSPDAYATKAVQYAKALKKALIEGGHR